VSSPLEERAHETYSLVKLKQDIAGFYEAAVGEAGRGAANVP
jgi:hypothetical protein